MNDFILNSANWFFGLFSPSFIYWTGVAVFVVTGPLLILTAVTFTPIAKAIIRAKQ